MIFWQLEAAELRDRLIYEVGGKLPAEKKEQAVANYVQKANIKKNAALAIKVMYKKILDILKKVRLRVIKNLTARCNVFRNQ